MNTVTFAENVLRTARHTVRLLRTHPGFVLTVVLSLALGIGANTTIFSVVHGVLIQPLPGVTALDPLTYALSGAALGAGAILASVVPARRAACVDPMETLRSA
jgi:ABC-type lipoprotein release transport system permease subunit